MRQLTHFLGVSLAILCSYGLHAQTEHGMRDLLWPFGYANLPVEYWGISALDFRNGSVDTTYLIGKLDFFLGQLGGAYLTSKHTGEPLLYADGCHIYNQELDIISGSDVLFSGTTSLDCPPYAGVNSSIFLSTSTDSTAHYISYRKTFNFDAPPNVFADTIGIWNVTLHSAGNYTVQESKFPISNDRRAGSLTATSLELSQGDWWVATLAAESDGVYIDRIYENGQWEPTSEYPLPATYKAVNGSFQTAFSAAGDRFAYGTDNGDLRVFDFDNATGELSNFRSFPLPDTAWVRGVCFSPNGQLLYTILDTTLYQLEIATGMVRTVASHSSAAENGWPVAMGEMYLGPDCRIYVSPSSTTWYLHVIHQPNAIGTACQFQPRAIRTPTRLDFALPNRPIFRRAEDCLDLDWPFDPPVSTTERSVASQRELRAFPTPARGAVSVFFPAAARDVQWQLYDPMGRRVRTGQVDQVLAEAALTIPRNGLPAAWYWLAVRDALGTYAVLRIGWVDE